MVVREAWAEVGEEAGREALVVERVGDRDLVGTGVASEETEVRVEGTGKEVGRAEL